jgi:nucleotide-binding universal stress UspA family protein
MGTIVAGFDGTDQAERALARAAELAEVLEAKLVVVSVVRPLRLALAEPMLADPTLVPAAAAGSPLRGATVPLPAGPAGLDQPGEALLLLEQARGLLAPRGVEAEYVPEVGDPATRLLDVADDRDAEIVVVGSRHHGLLERILGHGVDEKLVRKSHRDLLLVH